LREIAGTGSGRNGVGNAFLFFIRNFRVQGIRKGTAGCGASVGNGVSMLREDRALNGSHGPDSAATGRKAAGIVSVCGLTNNESGAPAPVFSGGSFSFVTALLSVRRYSEPATNGEISLAFGR